MADYPEILDFYEEYKYALSSDERAEFNEFFNTYPNERSFVESVDIEPITSLEFTVPEHIYVTDKPKVFSADPLQEEIEIVFSLVDDFDELISGMKSPISYVEKSDRHKPMPLDSWTYPEKALVRKRRKQWGGKPNYRTYDFSPSKSVGYALRSMKRHLPTIEVISIKDVQEKMKRSISHIHIKADITPFETQRSRMEVDLFDAYEEFATHLFELEQENTDNKKDAWDVTMPSGALDDFIRDNYSPTIVAFAELPSEMRDFIAKEWNEYGEKSRKGREQAYGYNLSKEQVGNLQDADKSYLREMM